MLAAVLVLALVLGLLLRSEHQRRARRSAVTRVQQSFDEAQHLVDQIVADGARRMRQLAHRRDPSWKEW